MKCVNREWILSLDLANILSSLRHVSAKIKGAIILKLINPTKERKFYRGKT